MKTNVYTPKPPVYNHAGGLTVRIDAEQQLRRSVMACMLWESEFYESGVSIAKRIGDLVPQCRPEFVAACAYEARHTMHLRHVPLLLMREMARHPSHKTLLRKLIPDVISRPDELSEFLAIYWKDGKQFISNPVRRGLAKAFEKFNEFSLAKYNGGSPSVKLRDVMFLVHPKRAREEVPVAHELKHRKYNNGAGDVVRHKGVLDKLANNTLTTPDTWETALSAGADKKETFERLMRENSLGGLAFLRNLRNMHQAGISTATLTAYAEIANFERVLPFQFLAAARVLPELEHVIEPMMLKAIEGQPKFPGKTVVLVDVSGSMSSHVSMKSTITRLDAACGVAILLRELCDDVSVYTFSSGVVQVPSRRGFALRDAIVISQPHASTYLGLAVEAINKTAYDRIIVITDEQSADQAPAPIGKGYVVNVASYRAGVDYKRWMHIDGWSEGIIRYIQAYENAASNQ